MDEDVGAFFHGGARCFQFGRMNRDAQFARMTLFNRRANDRPKAIDRMVFIDDVPDLHQVRFLLGQFADELARLIGSFELHYRRIAKIEFLARNARDQRAGDSNARCVRGRIRCLPDLEIPHWPADIDHAGDAAAEIAREYVIQV